jgi:hypothetical protein
MIGIVGGGLAAAKVVEGYRGAGGEDPITIWSQDPHGPYHRPPLSKRLLRGEAEASDVLAHPAEWYAENDVDLRLGESIKSLDEVDAERVVIATGARPRELEGTLGLRTLDDSLELRRHAETAKTATVIGGGFIGCEVTASLTLLGLQVTQIVREPLVFAPLQAPPLSEWLHDTFRAHGVDLRLETGDIPPADMVVAGIGGVRARSPSATWRSSSTPSSAATGGSSTGRTRPTTARRSARSSLAKTCATTPSRPSSPSSSGRASRRSATRPATTRLRSKATSQATAPSSASFAAAGRSAPC